MSNKRERRRQLRAKRRRAELQRYPPKLKQYGVLRSDKMTEFGTRLEAGTRVEILREEKDFLVIAGVGEIHSPNGTKPPLKDMPIVMTVTPGSVMNTTAHLVVGERS